MYQEDLTFLISECCCLIKLHMTPDKNYKWPKGQMHIGTFQTVLNPVVISWQP